MNPTEIQVTKLLIIVGNNWRRRRRCLNKGLVQFCVLPKVNYVVEGK